MLGKRQGKLPEGFGKKLMKALTNEESDSKNQAEPQQVKNFVQEDFEFEAGFGDMSGEQAENVSEPTFDGFDDMPEFYQETISSQQQGDQDTLTFENFDEDLSQDDNISFDDFDLEDEPQQHRLDTEDEDELMFSNPADQTHDRSLETTIQDDLDMLFVDEEDDIEPVHFASPNDLQMEEKSDYTLSYGDEAEEEESDYTLSYGDEAEEEESDYTLSYGDEAEEEESDYIFSYDEQQDDNLSLPEDDDLEENNSSPFMDWESELDMQNETDYNTSFHATQNQLNDFEKADFTAVEELAAAFSVQDDLLFDNEPNMWQESIMKEELQTTQYIPSPSHETNTPAFVDNDMMSEIAEFTNEVMFNAGSTGYVQENIPQLSPDIPVQQEYQVTPSAVSSHTMPLPVPVSGVSHVNQQSSSMLLGHSQSLDTVINLIANLPQGVTKQTGAIIIKQTMEAMGTSMGEVLKNAQNVQVDLQKTVKDKLDKIEEHKTYIKQMEDDIRFAQKKAGELSEIINLFVQTGTI